jgi:nitronate monooxygenase
VASVGTGEDWPDRNMGYLERSRVSLRDMLRKTKSMTSNPIGVNIMCALTNYEDLVRVADEEGVDVIISGAGLPMKLPGMVKNRGIKLIPIVSSGRAAELICRTWLKRHDRLPDAIVVEGTMAGGHLGFSADAVLASNPDLESIVREVLAIATKYADDSGVSIPVIAAGGIFDGKDIARFLALGAGGVQMGTRFVCTEECDTSIEYKKAYINCVKEDLLVMESPVGLPIRVIRNDFVENILHGKKADFRCQYKCLLTCDPDKSAYCIAEALVNAYRGNMDAGFATCGANAYRMKRIVSVRELISELMEECLACMFPEALPAELASVLERRKNGRTTRPAEP